MELSCFVLMPFGQQGEYIGGVEESRAIYDQLIVPCVKEAAGKLVVEVDIHREVERNEAGDIPHSIVRNIAEADLALVDLTGRNANVFLELGMRFTMHRSGTILIAQSKKDIPFNIGAYRTVIYSSSFFKIDDCRARLTEAIRVALEQRLQEQRDRKPGKIDSLVYDTFPKLEVKLEGVLPESFRVEENSSRVVPWEEYWKKIEIVGSVLSQAHAQGHYDPDVLVGISNGGLLFADSILRIAYANAKPLLSLWAYRKPGTKYFENNVNYELLTGNVLDELRIHKPKDQKVEFLVFDDMVGSGTTFNQLLEYLKKTVPNWEDNFNLVFVFLYASSETRVEQIRKYLLTEHPVFRDRMRDFSYLTDKRELPYRKELAYGDIAEN